MIDEPSESTSSETSEYEKDRVAWNLPHPRPSTTPEWRMLELDRTSVESGAESGADGAPA